jgi:hypothetical protein
MVWGHRGSAGTQRRPRRWTLAAAVLFALALCCELLLTRGFLQAAAADSVVFTGATRPPALITLYTDVMQMTTAWVTGAFHPRHLEAWERSSLPVDALALTAFGLSFYLRRRRR